MPANTSDNFDFDNCENLWIAIGDIHDEPGNLARIPELPRAKGIIVSGDLTIEGGPGQAARVLDAIAATGLPVLAQIGNMDLLEVNQWLSDRGINLHDQVRELAPGIAIFGIGGSTFTPMHTPSEFSEAEYARWLDEMWQKAKASPHAILVSHNPPKDTPCDAINPSLHVGSEAVRDFILQKQPDICVCGHIHEGRSATKLGRTEVINPGTLAEGGYVLIGQSGDRLAAALRRLEA